MRTYTKCFIRGKQETLPSCSLVPFHKRLQTRANQPFLLAFATVSAWKRLAGLMQTPQFGSGSVFWSGRVQTQSDVIWLFGECTRPSSELLFGVRISFFFMDF